MTDSKQHEDDLREDLLSATEEVAILRLKLNHRSLSELEKEGVVSLDRAGNLVKEGPHFPNKWEEIN